MKNIITAFFIFIFNTVYSQHQADNWYFGLHAGISFSTNPPSTITGGKIYTGEGESSVSDANGNLLFYSDGLIVFDGNHDTMPNGTGLLGGPSSTQSCLIVKQPGTALYYLFTAQDYFGPGQSNLAYSIVDLSLNNGFGDVINKNTIVYNTNTEKLTAVLHSNNIDIWIVGQQDSTNNYRSYLLTSSGLSIIPYISSIGIVPTNSGANRVGYLKGSPNGNYLAAAFYHDNFAELFNFNRTTGEVYNPLVLGNWSAISNDGSYGLEFSPDESHIYASNLNPPALRQWNLLAGSPTAIVASVTIIDTSGAGALQLGPDGRIYVNHDTTLSCITQPNIQGLGCSFVYGYIGSLNEPGGLGLPNFPPWYFNGLNVGINETKNNVVKSIYPNPFGNELNIETANDDITEVVIYDISSRSLLREKFIRKVSISTIELAKGMYVFEIKNKQGLIKTGKIVKD